MHDSSQSIISFIHPPLQLGCEGPLEAVGLDPAAVVAGLAASPRSPRVVYDEATGFALAAGQVD